MSKVAYVDGAFVPHDHATVRMEDRGYQFADGAYEVVYFKHNHMVDIVPHLKRLYRSLDAIKIQLNMPMQALIIKIKELIRLNQYAEGFVYLQVTRGVAPRDHVYPQGLQPILTMSAKKLKYRHHPGSQVFTEPDIRWRRNDVKSISLLGNLLAKNAAAAQGGFEAWLVDDDGYITEASAANAWIVDAQQTLITTPISDRILNGITRERLIQLMAANSINFEERKFTEQEALGATEAFITSSTKAIVPIIKINGKNVGAGTVGPMVQKLQDLYLDFVDNGQG